MYLLPRFLGAPLLCLAFVALAFASPASPVPVTREVMAVREAVQGMNNGTGVDSVVNLFAPMQMRVIGANDATWKRDNANWASVLQMISNDLKKDLTPARAPEPVLRCRLQAVLEISL